MYKDILKGFKMQNFVVKKTLTETLRRMKVGQTMRIKSRDFKYSAVKTAKNKAEKKRE